jgi:hypothetical protein
LRAVDLVYLSLGGDTGTPYEGYVVDGTTLRRLPIGATLDAAAGTFAWQLGPGFVGVYDLLFVRTVQGQRERIPVRFVVQPTTDAATPLAITAPASSETVPTAFTVSGWALNGSARGLRTLTVYAYPADGSEPFYVGEGAVDSAPLDASAPFGGQFTKAPFAIDVNSLAPGTYHLLVVARSRLSPSLDATIWTGPITVR